MLLTGVIVSLLRITPTTTLFPYTTLFRSDFYLAVPSAVLRFLETDTETKIVAKPQLRGAEGRELTLNLGERVDRKSTRLNSSHSQISYAVFCLKKKNTINEHDTDVFIGDI